MSNQIEYFNIPLPNCLALKIFTHRHSLAVNFRAVVQVLNREL